eukprot:TRINITY_DN1176_c3_g1_i1.p1 TRINITY_DN1176_c3_g1~~TRINITY_DN1176_c3_g1_i1.p1  ORF type:complete len:793 (+),score=176.42 TRINITY_DN1176_c3_g1_i1:1458-3836(+)
MKTVALSVALTGMGAAAASCKDPPFSSYGYCNQTLTAYERAADLANRLNDTEIANMLANGNTGCDRLGVPQFRFTEALHGVVSACGRETYFKEFGGNNTGCPTSFPHAMVLGSSFNRSLWSNIGETISTEARALSNQGLAGIAFWAPDINLARDPRWGRSQEVASEDPFLNGEYVMNWARSFQEGGPTESKKYLKAVSTAKHFHDYDCEKCQGCDPSFAGECDRGGFNAIVSDQDQVEYYWPAWRAAIEGAGVHSVMCSYNAVNGIPSCGNDLSMNQVMRGKWNFDGYVVSDCGAVGDPAFTAYGKLYLNGSTSKQVNQAITSGCDLNCGSYYTQHMPDALKTGVLSRDDANTAFIRTWSKAFSLGFMDDDVPYHKYGPELVDTPAHRELALSASEQGMVLLKNDGDLLPLSTTSSVAMIGPHLNATQEMISIYHGTVNLANIMSPYQVFKRKGVNIASQAVGCSTVATDDEPTSCTSKDGFDEAVAAAKKAEVAIVFVGLTPGQMKNDSSDAREDEGWDRNIITLPGYQEDLIKAVYAANPKTVVVLIHGLQVSIDWTRSTVPAILDAHYPGEVGGEAIYNTLFGKVSPAGRATTTVYPAAFAATRPIANMNMRDAQGITYKYYTGTPLWEFGFGLSYTTFKFESINTTVSVTAKDMLNHHAKYFKSRGVDYSPALYEVKVTNTGKVPSGCVVLGFVSSADRSQDGHADAPLKELFGYDRVFLQPGETTTVILTIPPQVLSMVDSLGDERIVPGSYQVTFGVEGSSEGTPASALLEVTGEPEMVFSLSQLK